MQDMEGLEAVKCGATVWKRRSPHEAAQVGQS